MFKSGMFAGVFAAMWDVGTLRQQEGSYVAFFDNNAGVNLADSAGVSLADRRVIH
jgi:hypothetical protein